jgi:hypothetical protein
MHQQTFQYQITFHMMKTMYHTHKIVIANEYSICFHGKNIKRFYLFLGSKKKEKRCALQPKWINHRLVTSRVSSTHYLYQQNITLLVLHPLLNKCMLWWFIFDKYNTPHKFFFNVQMVVVVTFKDFIIVILIKCSLTYEPFQS